MSDVTQVLQAIGRGDGSASEDLLPLVYDELRRLAAARMAQEAAGQTLQPTALVHEAWLRMVKDGERSWQNRAHFFGAAAEAMRRILIEKARRKSRIKHGGDQARGLVGKRERSRDDHVAAEPKDGLVNPVPDIEGKDVFAQRIGGPAGQQVLVVDEPAAIAKPGRPVRDHGARGDRVCIFFRQHSSRFYSR